MDFTNNNGLVDDWFARMNQDTTNLFDLPDLQDDPNFASAPLDPTTALPQPAGPSDQNGETRLLLLLILSRLDSLERFVIKVDTAMEKNDNFMTRIDSAMESIKVDLQKFTTDMISFLKGSGLLPGPQADEEMGLETTT